MHIFGLYKNGDYILDLTNCMHWSSNENVSSKTKVRKIRNVITGLCLLHREKKDLLLATFAGDW
jgi:hypothetical protein